MAPSVVTLIRRMPQTMASIMSAKAHVDVSNVAMTSPEGRSVCHEWLRLEQVVVAAGDGATERAQRGAPVHPAADAAEERGGGQHERRRPRAAARTTATIPRRCGPRCDMRLNSAANRSGAATALASVPSTIAVQAPVKATRSGCMWRQQYASVSLVDALGKRVRSPMGISRWEVEAGGLRTSGAHRWCAAKLGLRPGGQPGGVVVGVSDQRGRGRARRSGTSLRRHQAQERAAGPRWRTRVSVRTVPAVGRVVIPAMWSPRFRLVVQPRNGSPRARRMAQET